MGGDAVSDESVPILLVGMPRSGTTWIGKIFDSHPDTLYRHEPDSVEPIEGVPLAPPVGDWRRYRPAVEGFVRRVPDMRSLKVSGSMPVFPKRYLSALGLYRLRAGIAAAKIAARLAGEWPVPRAGRRPGSGEVRLVWKSIESTGRLGVLVRCAPMRAVLILRHPCGYVASVLRGEARRKFGDRSSSSEDYGILGMLLDTPAGRSSGVSLESLRSLSAVERLAWRWRLFNDQALIDTQGREDVLVMYYEDLCDAPSVQVERMFRFAGLAFSEQTERFVAASTSTQRGGYYAVFKDPRAAAGGWRGELAPDAVARILAIAAAGPAGSRFASGSGGAQTGASAAAS